MRIAEDMIGAKDVPLAEWPGSRFLKVFAGCLVSIGNAIPGGRHDISRITRPGRTFQSVAFRKIFSCSCTEGSPTLLILGRVLRHLNRIVDESLTAPNGIQK